MKRIREFEIRPDEAAFWFLGQAGCIVKACGLTLVIDPYLSDSVVKIAPELPRRYPPPLAPEELQVDVWITTHDHEDHLDADTLGPYRHKASTLFVAPRLTARALRGHGVPEARIVRIDAGEQQTLAERLTVAGVYAVPTGADVLDTTGYLLQFSNGRSLYHTSDTAFSSLLLSAAPHAEVLFTCINGKWSNLTAEQAVQLTLAVRPRYAIPNHYDLFALNCENPETFVYLLGKADADIVPQVLEVMQPWVWK